MALICRPGEVPARRKGVGGTIGHVHWESPIVMGGRVYCPDETDHLVAYGL